VPGFCLPPPVSRAARRLRRLISFRVLARILSPPPYLLHLLLPLPWPPAITAWSYFVRDTTGVAAFCSWWTGSARVLNVCNVVCRAAARRINGKAALPLKTARGEKRRRRTFALRLWALQTTTRRGGAAGTRHATRTLRAHLCTPLRGFAALRCYAYLAAARFSRGMPARQNGGGRQRRRRQTGRCGNTTRVTLRNAWACCGGRREPTIAFRRTERRRWRTVENAAKHWPRLVRSGGWRRAGWPTNGT